MGSVVLLATQSGHSRARASRLARCPQRTTGATKRKRQKTMTNAIFESVPATRPDRLRLASPATAADTGVSPDVTGFYDEATGSVQYVVADPVTRKSAIIDPVLDFDPRSG